MTNVLMTPEGHEILKWADRSARQRHQSLVDTEHLLDGALQHNLARRALEAGGVDPDALLDILLMELGLVRDEPLEGTLGLTKQAIQRLESTESLAKAMGQNSVNSAHIALAMLTEPEPLMAEILSRLPALNLDAMRRYIQEKSPKTEGSRAEISKLDRKAVKQARQRRINEDTRRRAKNSPQIVIASRPRTGNPNLPYIIGGVVVLLVAYGLLTNPSTTGAILLVLGGWVFSVVIHEFAHAIVAYWGGDHTVVEKGYLSLNPLKYAHPLTSIGLPLLFLAMGGIGLPGGAVYIETHRLRSKYWRTAVALAGPLGSFICLIVFSAPFWTGMVTDEKIYQFPAMASIVEDHFTFWSALALLSALQVMAILFNLIPLPPLDGFNAIEPFLPPDIAHQMRTTLGTMGLFIILILFWFTPVGELFFNQVWELTDVVNIPRILIDKGFDTVLFWRNN